jgi:hypothetical protein
MVGYVPVLGIVMDAPGFSRQFDTPGFDARSMAATPIEYFRHEDKKLNQHASGFFYRSGDAVYLVTARHAISG